MERIITASMDELAQILRTHGIDTQALRILDGVGQGSFYALTTHGSHAFSLWRQLRAIVAETRFWPVILGEEEELNYRSEDEAWNQRAITKQILDDSSRVDPFVWIQEQLEQCDEWEHYLATTGEDNLLLPGMQASFPDPEMMPEPEDGDFSVTHDYKSIPYPVVYIGLLPTTTCWEVPAILRFGDWNECPPPELHVRMMKRWYELYGAEVVGCSHDVIEMIVARPPLDYAHSLRLSYEQYAYCADIVDQGTETVEALAQALRGSSYWFFWWD